MKKILLCLFFFTPLSYAMQTEQNTQGVTDIEKYTTFLYFIWGPKLYEFHENNLSNEHAKKLMRFKNNYLCSAILHKHLNKYSDEEAARLSYRTTPSGACALHNILYGNLDDFDENDYTHTNLMARWRDELEYIEKNHATPATK